MRAVSCRRCAPSSLRRFMLCLRGSEKVAVVHGTADLPKIGQAPVTVIVLDELNLNFADESYAPAEARSVAEDAARGDAFSGNADGSDL